MPFITEIRRPTNGLCLASFLRPPGCYYRLENGAEFPLEVDYAWCHRCERFVECERLYSIEEIEQRIRDMADRQDHWEALDAKAAEQFANIERELPSHLTQAAIHETWRAALAWRHHRQTPPQCLQCGSFFAIKTLPIGEEVPHPAGTGRIIVADGGHASTADIPELAFFNADGVRLRPTPPDSPHDDP